MPRWYNFGRGHRDKEAAPVPGPATPASTGTTQAIATPSANVNPLATAAPSVAPNAATAGPSRQTTQATKRSTFPIPGRTDSSKVIRAPENKDLIKDYYKRYSMEWPVLQNWLATNFPNHTFDKKFYDATKDNYLFYIPRKLTLAEREELRKLETDFFPE